MLESKLALDSPSEYALTQLYGSMRIWTYGCSFTSGFMEYYLLAERAKDAWPHLLDIGQEYEVVNRGIPGAGFYSIRNEILKNIGTIRRDDLIICQLPNAFRIEVPYFVDDYSSFINIQRRGKEVIDRYAWFKYLRTFEEMDQVLEDETEIVFDMLNRLGLRFLWWSVDNPSNEFIEKYSKNYIKLENDKGYYDWIHNNKEYWNVPEKDFHQNGKGHQALADIISKRIIEYLGDVKHIR